MLLRLALGVALLLWAGAAAAEPGRSVVDLKPRPGVTLRVLIDEPQAPSAAVILFSGGAGIVTIGDAGGVTWGQNNFLIRTRALWLQQGVLTAVMDAPSNQQSSEGLGAFRFASSHADDVAAVIRLVRSRTDRPVWLVGTSRGTQSVANAAIRLKTDGPDGIALTSSMLSTGRRGDDLFVMDLAAIRVPVLIAHHRDDQCIATPAGLVPRLAQALVNAPKVDVLYFEGGAAPRSDPCEALSRHGYIGIEGKVVGDIATWIKANSR